MSATADSDYADEIRRSQRKVQTVERKSILAYRTLMAVLLAVAIIAFVPINAAHNFQYFENMVGGIDAGTGWYALYVSLAIALVVVSAGLWMLLPDTQGAVWVLCLLVAMGAGIFSHYASYLSLDTQSVATIQEETANSTKSRIAMMGVEAMAERVKAASASSQTASAAVGNLTSQYGGWDAASVGEVNRNQLPGLTNAQNAAGADLRAASTAMERAMSMANETANGSGEGTLASVFKDFGAQWGWTPEGTRVFTNAFGSGVISWVPLIVTFVMGFVAFKPPAETNTAPAREKEEERDYVTSRAPDEDDVAIPAPRPPRSIAADSDLSDKVQGPMFAPKKAQSAPADRTPDNKRQATYEQKLAKMRDAIGGKDFPDGEIIGINPMKDFVGGNSKTINALRSDLASAGVAHWRGKSLFAGAE